MRVSGFLRALTVVACCFAGACGGDRAAESPPADQTASASLDPCSLITKAEADEALGAVTRDPERPSEANIPPGLLTCRYIAPRGEALAVMTVMVRTGFSESEAKTAFQGTREVGETQAVSGLGDDAFWLMDQLYVLKGTRSITVSGDFDRPTGEALARKVLERLAAHAA